MKNEQQPSHAKWDQRIEDGILDLYLAQQLDDDTAKEVEDHLTGCSNCRESLDNIKGMDDFVTGSLNYSASTTELADRVIYNVFRQQPQVWQGSVMSGPMGTLLRAAAVILVLAGCGLMLESSDMGSFNMYAPMKTQDMAKVSGELYNERDSGIAGYENESAWVDDADIVGGLLIDGKPTGESLDRNYKQPGLASSPATKAYDGRSDTGYEMKVNKVVENSLRHREAIGGKSRRVIKEMAATQSAMRTLSNRSLGLEQLKNQNNEGLSDKKASGHMALLRESRSVPKQKGKTYLSGFVHADSPSEGAYPGTSGNGYDQEILNKAGKEFSKKIDGNGRKTRGAKHEAMKKLLEETERQDLRRQNDGKAPKESGSNNAPENSKTRPGGNLKLIFNGNLSFEINNYQTSLDTLYQICKEEGGFVASENSARGANGKIRGSVVLRVPPETFDRTILKLRGLGELKSQSVSTQDVTDKYFDISSRIRNKKVMEKRLLEIIEKREGKMEEILKVEKELAKTREEIEILQGKINLYDNLISFSTITLQLTETGIYEASVYVRTETGTLGVAAKNVEDAFQKAKDSAEKHNVRVRSAVFNEGQNKNQHSATMEFEMKLDVFTVMLTELKALGLVRNSDVKISNKPREGRNSSSQADPKQEDGKGVIHLTLFTLMKVTKESGSLQLNSPDVNDTFAKVKQLAAEAKAEIKYATILDNKNNNRQHLQANMQFEVASDEFTAFMSQLKSLGNVVNTEVKDLNQGRSGDIFGDVPGNRVSVIALQIIELKTVYTRSGNISSDVIQVEDVYNNIKNKLKEMNAKVTSSQIDRLGSKVTGASISFEINDDKYDTILSYVKGKGFVTNLSSAMLNNTAAEEDAQIVFQPEKLALLSIQLRPTQPILSKTASTTVQVSNVKKSLSEARDLVMQSGGEILDDARISEAGASGQARLVVKVAAKDYENLLNNFLALGKQKSLNSATPQYSVDLETEHRPHEAEITLLLTDVEPTLPGTTGTFSFLGDSFRDAFGFLMGSVSLILKGFAFVLPFGLIALLLWKLTTRSKVKA